MHLIFIIGPGRYTQRVFTKTCFIVYVFFTLVFCIHVLSLLNIYQRYQSFTRELNDRQLKLESLIMRSVWMKPNDRSSWPITSSTTLTATMRGQAPHARTESATSSSGWRNKRPGTWKLKPSWKSRMAVTLLWANASEIFNCNAMRLLLRTRQRPIISMNGMSLESLMVRTDWSISCTISRINLKFMKLHASGKRAQWLTY